MESVLDTRLLLLAVRFVICRTAACGYEFRFGKLFLHALEGPRTLKVHISLYVAIQSLRVFFLEDHIFTCHGLKLHSGFTKLGEVHDDPTTRTRSLGGLLKLALSATLAGGWFGVEGRRHYEI